MQIRLGEDTKWYVVSDEGRVLAGPFAYSSEATLAEFEIEQLVAEYESASRANAECSCGRGEDRLH